ncbi:MAG: peptide chain release factor N(5)-glutamine methyltransferase [Desulfobulbus sp.]|jgi:release factor glutamine methyltransferase|uniref:peptide chain release factor N(5)-glutamine methyltransferase n=1 Tax=Desulfobulbus sp. TaxID=895 RepID=UPI00284202D9|nr:peptide chain release factor N(5)-glutamine methyltransferase [Desulfobulbus sp.]MDR2550830.1 peptide chain release factor N(5)-glutamine methyltransferase [Desulfobulbus sp.]
MRIDTLLAEATARLLAAGVTDAALDARLLLQHLTGWNRSQMILHAGQPVDEAISVRYQELIARRCQRIPLQHLTGLQEFWSLDFAVSPAVLIPRPETEFLLEQVLAECRQTGIAHALDLCTGSGAIAVVLARELGCSVVAADISEAALRVARENSARHMVTDLVSPVCCDLFAALNGCRPFDLIVSNPPYVAEEEVDGLEPEVAMAEPRLALSGGPGGMHCIERIARAACRHLRPGGWIFLEIGADQGGKAARLFRSTVPGYGRVLVSNDWAGRPRILRARHEP